jgi:hypothetical protein
MWITAAAALGVLVTGGCGTDQPAVCDSLAAVQTSMDHVRNANVSENGLTQLQTDLTQLRADLVQLRTDAQTQFPTQIEGVRTAVNQFAASVAAARATPEATTLAAVRTGMSGVQDSVRHLADAMSGTC